MKSAAGYVTLAERVSGPIPRPVDFSYVWGDALEELKRVGPHARIINLETAVTKSEDYEDKGINYRMHPANIGCITAAGIDCCSLANNHALDWGYSGLIETLETLKKAGIKCPGAGRKLEEAEAPAVLEIGGKGKVLVFSCGSTTSGIPLSWAASESRAGVNLLADFSPHTFLRIKEKIGKVRRRGDIVVLSIHWGPNWGYEVPEEQREFAHKIIDEAGVDIIHGHSSHHVKGIEVYNERLILYGCGDFIDDYEGISGYEHYRGELGLMYFAAANPLTGSLVALRMTPTRVNRFRVNRASGEDALRLKDILDREGKKFGTRVELSEDNALTLKY